MKEIEVKVLDINKQEIIRKLKKLGAKKVFDRIFHPIFLDFPDSRLDKKGIMLRLRKEGNKYVLAYKKKLKIGLAKTYDEKEVIINDPKKLLEMLFGIGLIEKNRYTYRRITYNHNNTEIYLGKISYRKLNIPWYLEIEAKNENIIEKYIKILQLDKKNVKPWTAKEMINYYRKKK